MPSAPPVPLLAALGDRGYDGDIDAQIICEGDARRDRPGA
jgi:hypothetical protein